MYVDHAHCVGCGRCLGACNFDAITFDEYNANEMLNARMAEYTKAVVDGRPNFHISLIVDVSPNCDCHRENDTPILPNIGMFASFDPLALDQACVDACLAANPMPNSQLSDNLKKPALPIGAIRSRIPRRNPNGAAALTTPRRLAWVTVSMN